MSTSARGTPGSASIKAYRWAVAGVSLAWLYRLTGGYSLFVLHLELSLHWDFFPDLLSTPHVLAWLGLAPMVLGLAVFCVPRRPLIVIYPLVLAVCAGGLALHQSTSYIQTWISSFWVAIWLLWLGLKAGRETHDEIVAKGCFLAQLMISLVFLGAVVGKWTPRYWSGEVLHHLIFLYQPYPQYVWLRENLSPEDLRALATLYSRLAIIVETFMAAVVWMPRRVAFPFATLALLSMWAVVSPRIFDATGPLTGLAIAGWSLQRSEFRCLSQGRPAPTLI